MEPRIETLTEKKLMGKKMMMSLSDNKTGALWASFMPRRKEIQNTVNGNLYSLQRYDASYFSPFNPDTIFEKWAAVEVTDFAAIPQDMETMILPAGLYAVFLHKGGAATGAKTFQYIMGTWLPASTYRLDDRPHFEVLGDKYKNNDPDAEEEIWIPIQKKMRE